MRLGFPMKPCECLRVTGNIFRRELEGDEPMQPQVLGLINDPHTPAAQLLDDAVMRDGLADELGRGSHWRESMTQSLAGQQQRLLQLRVLRFGLLQNGMSGSASS
jgi:hypothetical protein